MGSRPTSRPAPTPPALPGSWDTGGHTETADWEDGYNTSTPVLRHADTLLLLSGVTMVTTGPKVTCSLITVLLHHNCVITG